MKTQKYANTYPTTNFLGLCLASSSYQQVLAFLKSELEAPHQARMVMTPNPEQIVLAAHDSDFYRTLQAGDVLLADGMGLVWASQLMGFVRDKSSVGERVAGVDVVRDLMQISLDKKYSVLIIGGRNYQKQIEREYQLLVKLKKIKWVEGFQQAKQPQPEEEKVVADTIKNFKPDMVFVALGAPEQEKWLVANREALNESGVKLAMAVGGSFDFLLGRVKRAPSWAQQLGLEWLFRLFYEPWRWKRQLRLLEFVWLVMWSLLTGKTNLD